MYAFRVIATNEIGESEPSDPVSLRSAVAPDAPSAPVKTFADGTRIEIEWDPPAGTGGDAITKYEVFMDDTSGSGFQSLGFTTDGSVTTWAQTDSIVEGDSYYFKVSAYNSISQGSLSSASDKIIAATVPGQPDAPTLVSQSKAAISIAWQAPSSDGGDPIIAYEIRWNGGTGSVFNAIGTHTDLGDLEFTKDTNLNAGTTYEFKVIATNEVGSSLESSSVAIKAAQAPIAPDAPVKVAADRTSIQITWSPPADNGASEITGYKVFWDNNSGILDESTALATLNAQTLTHL